MAPEELRVQPQALEMPPKGKGGSGKGGKGIAVETIRERGVGDEKGGSVSGSCGGHKSGSK